MAGLCTTQDAQAAPAAVRVPCSAPTLASAISAPPAGQTLSLAAHCLYRLTAPLPVMTQDLTIAGHYATLARSKAPGTPAFTILSADGATLAVSRLNFANGDNAISVTEDGSLSVQGWRRRRLAGLSATRQRRAAAAAAASAPAMRPNTAPFVRPEPPG
jgi:hypothetical protein